MSSESLHKTGLARRNASGETPIGSAARAPMDATVLPIKGARAARARGAILRRLLALSDWASLVAGTSVSYLLASGPPVKPSSIAWSAAFGPAWILVMKLHG